MLNHLVTAVTLALVFSAVCSLCEAVLYSLSASQVEMLRKNGLTSGKYLHELKSDIDEPITAILTLNTIANTVGASFSGAAAAKIFGDDAMFWFSGLFTIAILLLSEIIPKTIGVNYAFKLAPFVAYTLHWIVFVLKPFIWLCRSITRLIPKKSHDESISAEEIQTIASLSRKSGEIAEHQEQVISNILDLRTKIVRQVMTPRTVTFSINEHQRIDEAVKKFRQLSSHSRIPVYDREPNNISGIVLLKDILQAAAEDKNSMHVTALKQPVHFVPETAPLDLILMDFFERQQHLFVVVDEYGSVTGVISMEDVIEEIVGREIVDESDKTNDMRELARSRKLQDEK